MRATLSIFSNYRPDQWYKYILVINNKTVWTNSKEEVKMLLDLNGMRMSRFLRMGRFYEYGSMKDRTSHYICYYN